MAVKISALPGGATLAGGGSTIFEAVQSGINVKLTDEQLRTFCKSGTTTITSPWAFGTTLEANGPSGIQLNGAGNLYDVPGTCTILLADTNEFRIYNAAASAVMLNVKTTYTAPGSDNAFSCGHASLRWSVVYAATGTINTSDENLKADIRPISDAVLDAWSEVEFMEYRWKLGGKRLHIGVIAQRIEQVFARHGLDPFAYGLLCRDGDTYGVRPDECLFLESALMRRELKRLKKAA